MSLIENQIRSSDIGSHRGLLNNRIESSGKLFLLQSSIDCFCFILCLYKLFRIRQGGGFMNIGKGMLVYYIPNVVIQIATIILTSQKGIEDRFILPPAADRIASAQALRIIRNLWRSGQK
ncbi:hypothetical protein GGP41_000388 [Bipolaris sorokiniana]|uniref:Uncharacterized protein n=1 Tax=Cochliobolus sativus TaxID=45130 RepID=A0A8H5ZE78_COCSA|nr:hypothetical protein GGP41_000388 [Bipolaris sorokiniana]